jgi:hypothetical protein
MNFHSAFEAASHQGFKGYFWFPSLDPALQMPQWTRETIAEKINWLYNNVGPVRVVIDGLSLDEVDTGIWPKAATSSPAFNKASTDRFHESWKDARFFDSRARENVYTAQFTIRRHIRLHGELFGQMLRPDETNPFVRLHFIPSWQVRNTGKEPVASGLEEGVRSDLLGAALEYRVIKDRAGKTAMDVPASDMLHFHDHFWVGQKRGISGLAPVAKKLFKMDEIERMLANGIELRTMMAYAIERAEGDTGGPTLLPGVTSTEEIDSPDGGKLFVQKIVSPTGEEVTVAEPPAGRKIKVLESNQTGEPLTFKHDVLTDVAYCSLYPPDYVFAVASGALGTEIRWKVRRVQTVKNTVRQFQLIPQFLEPAYRFRTWQDIKRGLYDALPGGVPADWYKAKMICPADTTVDIGREGRLLDERVATGKMSEEEYHGIQGHDAGDVEDEHIATRERRLDKLEEVNARRKTAGKRELTYEEMWPANAQAAANSAARGKPDPKQDPEEEEAAQ